MISKIYDLEEDGDNILLGDLFDGVDEVLVVNDDEYNLINVDSHKVVILECNAAETDEKIESIIEFDGTQYELCFLMRIWTECTTGGKMKWNGEVHCHHGEQFKSWWCYRHGDNLAQQTNGSPELLAGNSYTTVHVRITNQDISS
eukprot:4484256-Ditylum_brightwellii.AAC.1